MSGVDCGKVHRGMVCTRPLGHKGMHRRRVAVESERERCLLRDTPEAPEILSAAIGAAGLTPLLKDGYAISLREATDGIIEELRKHA